MAAFICRSLESEQRLTSGYDAQDSVDSLDRGASKNAQKTDRYAYFILFQHQAAEAQTWRAVVVVVVGEILKCQYPDHVILFGTVEDAPRPLSLTIMLRRAPTTNDGKVVDRLQESQRINKPFKAPSFTAVVDRAQLSRKRKRAVSYKGQQAADDSDSDDGGKKKKKRKDDKDPYHNEEELLAAVKKYPVFKPKPFNQARRFSMPTMTNKDGETVTHFITNTALGIRPQTKIIPRPLHDPMEDHAIVLYDPTIDDRETDEERQERLKEDEKLRALKEAEEKTAGMFNPHKSLKVLLGEDKDKKATVDKVPVVIDPRLSKVLRPHQVEGVKVRVLQSIFRIVVLSS